MKTLGYMLFQQRYANTTSTGQLYRTELLTRSMHRQVVGLLQQAKEERMLVFSLYTILSHPSTVLCVCVCVCTVWSRCLLVRRSRGFCMQDYGGSCSKNSCFCFFLNMNDAQCVLKATEPSFIKTSR